MAGGRGRVLLATAAVAVIVVVAFILAYAGVPTLGRPNNSGTTFINVSTTTETTSVTISIPSISTATISTPSLITTTVSTSTSSSSTSARGTTSRTFNSTNYIVIPFSVGSNESLNFQPASITVVIGVNNTIIWSDLDAEQHTVTSLSVPSGAAKFNSGILNQGQTYALTLTVPGTYRYYCTIHPTWMRGTIIVKG